MSLAWFLRWTRGLHGTDTIRRPLLGRAAGRTIRRAQLELEQLEDRCLLAAWVPIGPSPLHDPNGVGGAKGEDYTGRVSALAVTANYDGAGHAALLLGAAGGGIWRSTNFTTAAPTWSPMTDVIGLPPDPANGYGSGAIDIGAIAVDPNNPRTIYAGTGEANYYDDNRYGSGILKSTDGGTTWNLVSMGGVNNEFFRRAISALFVDPTNSNTLYAAVVRFQGSPNMLPDTNPSQLGIYKSTDACVTWAKITSGSGGKIGDGLTVSALDYTWTAPNTLTIYAGVEGMGLFSSSNGGVTWQPLAGGAPTTSSGRISLAADHASGKTLVYAAVATTDVTPHLLDVFKSTDAGNTWTPLHAPDPLGNIGDYTLALGLSPNGRLYLGGTGTSGPPATSLAYESNVGGTSWRAIGVGSDGSTPHVDLHAWAFTADGTVYNGNDGGVWRFTPSPFDIGVGYPVGGGPLAVVAADFNRDGIPDLAVANNADDTVSILLGNGDGTFRPATPFSVRPSGTSSYLGPIAIIAVDLNRDGKLDLVTADQDGSCVSVLLGNGDGTFQNAATTAVDSHPTDVTSADFNGDGKPDLATTNSYGNSLSVLLGDGNGGFSSVTTVSNSYGTPCALAHGDFNGDGKEDLAVAEQNSNGVTVFLGNGDGTFQPLYGQFAVGAGPIDIAAGDFNGDGKTDLITANRGGNTVSVLLGNGDGTFQTAINSAAGNTPQRIVVTDFNGDGVADVAAANSNDDTFSVLYGRGNGQFQTPVLYSVGGGAFGIAAADFNGDGTKDIAVTNSVTNSVEVRLNNPRVGGSLRAAWDDLNTVGLQTNQINSIDLDPTDSNIMLEGSQDNGTARTSDGSTWNTVAGGDGGEVRFSQINHLTAYKWLAFLPSLAVSSDGGQTWAEKGVPGDAFPFYAVFAGDQALNNLVLGSTSKVWQFTIAGQWSQLSPDLSANKNITALAFAPSDPQMLYVGFGNGDIYRTNAISGGATAVNWPRVYTGAGWPVTSLVVDPVNPLTAYKTEGAFGATQIWQTTDGGAHWNAIATTATGMPGIPVNALALDSLAGLPVLYAGTDSGVYRGAFDGTNWAWARYGDGLPNVQIEDLRLKVYPGHPGTKVLAAATYGRGAWVIQIPTLPGVLNAPNNSSPSNASAPSALTTVSGPQVTAPAGSAFGPWRQRGPVAAHAGSLPSESAVVIADLIFAALGPAAVGLTPGIPTTNAGPAAPLSPQSFPGSMPSQRAMEGAIWIVFRGEGRSITLAPGLGKNGDALAGPSDDFGGTAGSQNLFGAL